MTGDRDGNGQLTEHVDWENVPPNPDLAEDLGYEIADMDVIRTNNGSGRLLFLPWDEEQICDESFIVAHEDAVVNLIDTR